MLRLAPRLFCPAFAAFFGCISFLGQGLHSLVEHPLHEGEVSACAHAGCGNAHRKPGCHDEQAGGPISADAQAATHGGLTVAADRSHDPHHCPICCFFAQAQWDVDFQPTVLTTAISPVAPLAERSVPLARVGVYRSRAPPTGAALS
jgi:hypothetical protein